MGSVEVLLVGALFVVILLVLIIVLRRKPIDSTSVEMLQREIIELRRALETQLTEVRKDVGGKLSDTTSTISGLQKNIGALEETLNQVKEITKEIRRLEDILAPPKIRGTLGETLLENILKEVLPREVYETQYRFSSGVVADTVVHVGKRILVIDSKFPLENYNRAKNPDIDEDSRNAHWKRFVQDVQKLVNQIREKYIRPSEGTFDFALMYVPAEGVYYEAFIEASGDSRLLNYAHERRVIPVSPSTLYAYLQVILFGLRGFQLEKKAEAILNLLRQSEETLGVLDKELNTLGNHIENALKKYRDFQGRFYQFSLGFSSWQRLGED